MGFLSRVASIASGTIDRALIRAEQVAGLRAADAESMPPEHPLAIARQASRRPLEDAPVLWSDPRWSPRLDDAADLVKAAIPTSVEPLDVGDAARAPKALASDPFQMVELLGWKERPTGVSFLVRDAIVLRSPIIGALINTRLGQVARYCRTQVDSHGIGFRIGHRDPKKNLSRAGRKMAKSLEHAILTTTTASAGIGRDDFEAFTRRFFYDSLVHDQATFEIIPSRRGKPHSWHIVDAKTIRLADTDERFLDAESDKKIRTVQILDGSIIAEWPADELAFMVRNPRSSIHAQGYGTSEIDMMIHVITAMLWAYDYNKRFFSQGATPKGLINFKGQVPGRQLAVFRRFFYEMVAGVENAWRTPVLNAEQGVEWISMQSSNRDMEYSAWMDFQIKLASAMYLIDSAEYGFQYGNAGDRSLFESATDQKVTRSQDKGLKPLLVRYQNELNKMIIQRLDPDFALEFMGLDALTQADQADLDEKKARTYMTIDEIREREGLDPMPDGEGRVINSPTWMQYKQAKDALAAQAQAPDGAPGEEGGAPAEGADEGGSPFDQAGEGGADGGGSLEGLLAKFKTPKPGAADGAPVSKAFDEYEV